jgi:hypothetical protein
MGCRECEFAQDTPEMIAYVRVENANVGILGCREHVGKLIHMARLVRGREPNKHILDIEMLDFAEHLRKCGLCRRKLARIMYEKTEANGH